MKHKPDLEGCGKTCSRHECAFRAGLLLVDDTPIRVLACNVGNVGSAIADVSADSDAD